MYTDEYNSIAFCKGKITGAELILGRKWETYRPEIQNFACKFSRWLPCVLDCVKYRDIISGERSTIDEIRKFEKPIQFDVGDDNYLYLYPQVIIHHKTNSRCGKIESKVFETNKEATDYFNSLVWKYNLETKNK